MDPVHILDHYRLSLVTSGESIQLLARLLRDGTQRTAELANKLESKVADINRLLTALYRAALVEQRSIDLWAITHLGEQVLDRLRVLDLASVDLALALADAPSDRLFIKRWLERPSSFKDSRIHLSLLRSLSQVIHLYDVDKVKRMKDEASLLYAILIAGDAWAQQTGIENVADVIRYGLESRLLADQHHEAVEQEFNSDSVAEAWRDGMQKYLGSNRLLLFIPTEQPSSTDDETVMFTWLRALNAALEGTADQGLRASCQAWQRDDATVFWRFIFKRKNFERDTRTLCAKLGGIHELATDKLLTELAERLLQAVDKTSPQRTYEAIADPTAKVQDDFGTLISMLSRLSHRVREEGIQEVPERMQEALQSALTEFSNAWAERMDR